VQVILEKIATRKTMSLLPMSIDPQRLQKNETRNLYSGGSSDNLGVQADVLFPEINFPMTEVLMSFAAELNVSEDKLPAHAPIPDPHMQNQSSYEPMRTIGPLPAPPPKIFYGKFWRSLARRAVGHHDHSAVLNY
jgi:hypothetical protein